MDTKIVFFLKLEKRDIMSSTYNITIKCKDCENTECRIGNIIFYSEDGCIRKVPEDLYIEYYHLMNEV